MATTKIRTHIRAARSTVYRLLLHPDAVKVWMVPDGMTGVVHRFEPEVGGSFSITLSYDVGEEPQHDAYYGRYLALTEDEEVVEVLEFVTEKPELAGAQSVVFTLSDGADGGTELDVVHDDLPPGLDPADNEAVWRTALSKLAAMAEQT
ncbi:MULTISPECIES: SRPBCC domain-containing protein [Nocardia]|uniref:Activator of HSP90 ATPase n=1 Tax=Nocardia coubleae TaxID=356147 RepID=A0A846WFI3_9NOCA|nr:SRPBCC domain-containing protein [Nocardia coubleae]NKX90988.1 activator of HSP90 ATPase [Nocardia coubleae]